MGMGEIRRCFEIVSRSTKDSIFIIEREKIEFCVVSGGSIGIINILRIKSWRWRWRGRGRGLLLLLLLFCSLVLPLTPHVSNQGYRWPQGGWRQCRSWFWRVFGVVGGKREVLGKSVVVFWIVEVVGPLRSLFWCRRSLWRWSSLPRPLRGLLLPFWLSGGKRGVGRLSRWGVWGRRAAQTSSRPSPSIGGVRRGEKIKEWTSFLLLFFFVLFSHSLWESLGWKTFPGALWVEWRASAALLQL